MELQIDCFALWFFRAYFFNISHSLRRTWATCKCLSSASASFRRHASEKHTESIWKCIVRLCERQRCSRLEQNIYVEVVRCVHQSRSLSSICVLKYRLRSEQLKTTLSHFGRCLSFCAFSSFYCSSKRLYSLINVIYDKNETLLSVYFSKQICYACVGSGDGELTTHDGCRHNDADNTIHLVGERMSCTWNSTL